VDASEGLCPTDETRQWFVRREEMILRDADAALAVSNGLLERCCRTNPSSHLLSNGASCPLPSEGRPEDLAALKPPLVGFVGRMGHWVDLSLVRDLAVGRPDCSIVLIGPVDTHDEALTELRQLSNVHFLGTKEFREVSGYIENMDVCIIPFKVVTLTSMANPVKFFEYASLGIPIVSTPLDGVLEHPGMAYISDGTSESFIEQVGSALEERDPALREDRKAMAREHDWDAITEKLERVLLDLCSQDRRKEL
jgi:glycosyltransferase involved in cell wall biosynthesis